MRITFIIMILMHGMIHLMGFLKAFDLANIKALTLEMPRFYGVLWLLAFTLFIGTAILYITNNTYWWLFAIGAVILSQILTFLFWSDAKFATIPNLLILTIGLISYSSYAFDQKIKAEMQTALAEQSKEYKSNPRLHRIEDLPESVQHWLRKSGALEMKWIENVYLKQQVKIKLSEDQKDWTDATAEQFNITHSPSFYWNVRGQMNPFFYFRGRDKFEKGKGEMLIKLLSIIPIVHVEENTKLDQAALQRYLAEIIWFPTVALHPSISWKAIDEHSAQATLSIGDTKGTGIFHFVDGEFSHFTAQRFKETDSEAHPKEWLVESEEIKLINGIRIPVRSKVSWKLGENNWWNWLQVEIINIKYNLTYGDLSVLLVHL